MNVNLHAVIFNVADLERSVEFYRGVFDFPVIGQRERATALLVHENDGRQVVVLREVGPNALHSGRGTIGPRVLGFEVGSLENLELIEQELEQRQALLTHPRRETWEAILGTDPDRNEFVVASSLTGAPISRDDWRNIDSMVFAFD
jgi:catechol 2,3-dioxygenase-like lactoylglutathione lyase family enzyme